MLVSHNHGVSQIVFHLIWKTKYSYKLLGADKYRAACAEVLREVAARHGIAILELAVQAEHVHIVISMPSTMSPSRAKQLLKGASSRELRKRFWHLRVRHCLWSRGATIRSAGDADLSTVSSYVRRQTPAQPTLDFFVGIH